jgi:hypothetical protein
MRPRAGPDLAAKKKIIVFQPVAILAYEKS